MEGPARPAPAAPGEIGLPLALPGLLSSHLFIKNSRSKHARIRGRTNNDDVGGKSKQWPLSLKIHLKQICLRSDRKVGLL